MTGGWKNWPRTNRPRHTSTIVPAKTTQMHTSSGEVMGREVVVAVTEGRLDLGTSGTSLLRGVRRAPHKRVLIKIIGE